MCATLGYVVFDFPTMYVNHSSHCAGAGASAGVTLVLLSAFNHDSIIICAVLHSPAFGFSL